MGLKREAPTQLSKVLGDFAALLGGFAARCSAASLRRAWRLAALKSREAGPIAVNANVDDLRGLMNHLAAPVFQIEMRDLEPRDHLERQENCLVAVTPAPLVPQL